MTDVITHEVFNQSTPLVDANLFTGNRALQDALRFNLAGFDAARFAALGAEAATRTGRATVNSSGTRCWRRTSSRARLRLRR